MLSATAFRAGAPLQHQRRAQASTAAGRRSAVQTQALFGFLAPKTAKPAVANKAQELVTELLELTEPTDGGLNASRAKREQIAALVDELEQYCPRNPLRSPLLYGDYEVLYASKPQTAGGPFRSAPGRIVFPGQRALQSIQEPNICVNEVTYKTLGFIPGSARQEGVIKAVSGDTFELTFPKTDGKRGSVPRTIQIAYLDDRIRVARFVPPEDAEASEPSFYVFKRLVEEEEEEEEEVVYEEEEEEPAPAPKRGGFAIGTRRIKAAAQASQEEEEEEEEAPPKRGLFGGFGTRRVKAAAQEEASPSPSPAPRRSGSLLLGRRDSLATMAEKRYAQQQGTGSRGVGTRGVSASPTRGAASGSTRKTREEIAAERAAARAAAEEERRVARERAEAERQAAREAAAAAKAAAEEERRARLAQQEAERARIAELKEAARAQLAQLQAEAAEAADEAKSAAAAVKEAEKAAAELLKLAGQARGLIDQAASAALSAIQQLEGIKQQEKAAAAELAEARSSAKQLEAAARKR